MADVSEFADAMIGHMNADHTDSLKDYCRAYGGLEEVTGATMTGLDSRGFDVSATTPDGERTVRVDFERELTDRMEIRLEIVRLAQEARERLEGAAPEAG